MAKLKKIFLTVRDIYEIAVPSLAFLMMFSVFIWGIFCRYVLNISATWSNEIQIMGYLWTVLPAALYGRRRNDHVAFSLLYDSVNPAWQRIIRILGNLFILVLYSFLIWGSIRYIRNLRQASMALEISLKYLYIPFPILVCGFWLYSAYDFIVDVRDIYLEKTGKKAPISLQKEDLSQKIRQAAEEDYNRLFSSPEKAEETK